MTEKTINDKKAIAGGNGITLARRYRILHQLGEGGMGLVRLAEDRR